jgi:predicted nucleic acid-binding protein
METSVEPSISGVIDTNVLVYAHVEDAEHWGAAASLLSLVRLGQQAVAVTPQILMEFYSIVTDA